MSDRPAGDGAGEAPAPRVFISHSNKDADVARAVCEHLEAHGIGCWIAPRDIAPGDSWASAIIAAISRCDVMVLIFSAHANASRQVLREVERALQRDRIILTYRVDDAEPGADMEYFLSTEQWLDARHEGGHAHLDDLRASVTRKLDVELGAGPGPLDDARRLPTRSNVDLAAWERSRAPVSRGRLLGLAAATLLALAAGWAFLGRDGGPLSGTPAPTLASAEVGGIAVLPFENRSRTESLEWLSTVLAEMVITDLSQVESLHVISNQELFAAVPEELIMAGTAAAPASREELVRRSGASAVLSGSYAQLGDTLQVSISLLDAESGEIMDARRGTGAPDEVFEIVDSLSRELRQALRLDDAELDKDLREVTTDSLEAYRYYVEGLQLDLRLKREEAIPLLQQAVRIDPTFAMAHARLGWIQQNLGRAGEARDSFEAAFSHRERLPSRERYLVEGLTFGENWDDYHKAVEAFENALALDPSIHSARHQLATLYAKMELTDEAIAEWEQLREAGYDYPGVENGLANMLFARGREGEAQRVMLEAVRRQPDNATVRLALGWIYAIAGETDDAREQFRLAREIQPAASPFLSLAEWRAAMVARDYETAAVVSRELLATEGPYAAWQGAMAEALQAVLRGDRDESLRQLESSVDAYGEANGFTAVSLLRIARLQRESGRFEAARRSAEAALAMGQGTWAGWEARFELALVHFALGDVDGGLALAEELALQAELDPGPVLERFALRLEGHAALATGDPATAVARFEDAVAVLPENGVRYHFQRFPDHGDAWFELAEAYLAAGRPADAIPWLHRLVNARVERLVAPLPYVRAYHRLGRAYAETGDVPAALAAYGSFLDYWGEGVMDGDRLVEARAYLDANGGGALAGQ